MTEVPLENLTTPVNGEPERGFRGPVVVVGLPRSGSTLLSRMLNESDDLFVVNDLYYLQRVDAIGGFGKLDREKRQKLLTHILSRLADRSRNRGGRELIASLLLSRADLRELRRLTYRLRDLQDADWGSLLEAMLTTAAAREGKRIWGWNTPQDYLHLQKIRARYSGSRFIFLIRDPYAILASYKNVSDPGNDPRRYQPLIQAFHWKLCVQTALSGPRGEPSDIFLLRYEDLIDDTDRSLKKISTFLGTSIPALDLTSLGTNSSFRQGSHRPVTPTERWLCDLVIGATRKAAGYPDRTGQPRLQDCTEVARVSWRSLRFHAKSLLGSPDRRARTRRFLLNLVDRSTGRERNALPAPPEPSRPRSDPEGTAP